MLWPKNVFVFFLVKKQNVSIHPNVYNDEVILSPLNILLQINTKMFTDKVRQDKQAVRSPESKKDHLLDRTRNNSSPHLLFSHPLEASSKKNSWKTVSNWFHLKLFSWINL